MPRGSDRVLRDRLARLNRIAQLLYANSSVGLKPADIARRVGVSTRTVYRDIPVLESVLGVPLWVDDGRYSARKSDFLPPLKLSLREAVALFLGARLMARFQDRVDPAVIEGFTKLATILPEPISRHVDMTVAELRGRPIDETGAEVVRILTEAWTTGRRVTITYDRVRPDGSADSIERDLGPYFLEANPIGHSTYVIAHDATANAVRRFRVGRIRSARLTDSTYEIPTSFDASTQFLHLWGISDEPAMDVRLLFHDAAAARRVRETRWHSSQREVTRADGALEVHFTAGGLYEISHWILTWGAAVEVLGPPVLRDRITAIAREMAGRYR